MSCQLKAEEKSPKSVDSNFSSFFVLLHLLFLASISFFSNASRATRRRRAKERRKEIGVTNSELVASSWNCARLAIGLGVCVCLSLMRNCWAVRFFLVAVAETRRRRRKKTRRLESSLAYRVFRQALYRIPSIFPFFISFFLDSYECEIQKDDDD